MSISQISLELLRSTCADAIARKSPTKCRSYRPSFRNKKEYGQLATLPSSSLQLDRVAEPFLDHNGFTWGWTLMHEVASRNPIGSVFF